MANLGLAGITSLSAINHWISTINTNLTNSKRTGYKETRVHLNTGFEDKIGVQFGTLNRQISIPSAYFQVEKTQILAYEQGMLTPTGNKTDFALSGTGYFVVEDDFGKRYATRDGEFHFNNDGILVNAKGLRVLSTAQDYIKVPSSEIFLVEDSGVSVSPNNKTLSSPLFGDIDGYSDSIYGNRKLMVIQIPNSDRLYYSKYGFTTFELGDYIPVDIENDFSDVMDGLNPHLVNYFDSTTSSIDRYETTFFHNKADSTVEMMYGASFGARRHASLSAHTFNNFITSVEFGITNLSDPSFGITFGKEKINDILVDNGTSIGSGFVAGLIENAGNLELVIKDKTQTYNSVILGPIGNFGGNVAPSNGNLSNNNTFKLTLKVNGFDATATIEGPSITGGAQVVTASIPYQKGYVSIGTVDTNLSALNGDLVRISNLTAYEYNKTTYNSMKILGRQASYQTDPLSRPSAPIAGLPRKDSNGMLDQDQEFLESSMVKQQYLEESTATLTDTMAILGNAQKVFSAVAKIINMYNSVTDDLNSLLR